MAGAAAGGAAIAASQLLGNQAADAATEATLPLTQKQLAQQNIKHVVFLMMENRSFDHLFGTLSVSAASTTRPSHALTERPSSRNTTR